MEHPHEDQTQLNGDSAGAGTGPFIPGMDPGDDAGLGGGLGSGGAAKKRNSGTWLVALIAVVAAVGLFSMRTVTLLSAGVDANTEMEATIEAFLAGTREGDVEDGRMDTAELMRRNEQVLRVLSESYTSRQIGLDELRRNPFIVFNQPVTSDGGPDPNAARREQQEARIADMQHAAKRLDLRSVLLGSDPLANIDNKIYRVGDHITVNGFPFTFVVKAINSQSVHLEGRDRELDVTFPTTIYIKRR